MLLRRTLLFAIVAWLPLGARADDSGYVRINLRRAPGNYLIAPVRINGHESAMILDTGAEWSCVNPANDLKYGYRPLKGLTVPVNGSRSRCTQLDSLAIGPVEVRQHKVVLIDVPGLDGLIGLELLRVGHAVIDCQQLRLFWKAVPSAPNVMAATLGRSGWTAIKLEVKGNAYFATGKVNGVAARFLVDTGAPFTTISRPIAAQARLVESGQRFVSAGIHIRDDHSGTAPVSSLSVGGFALKDIPIATSGQGLFRPFGPTTTAILGSDILGNNLGIIDCEQNVLYLKSPRG